MTSGGSRSWILRGWSRSGRCCCCCCCRGLGAANTDVTALYDAEVSEEVEDVGKDRLKTMVQMTTRSSLIAWSSTSLVGSVGLVQTQGQEPICNIISSCPLYVVRGDCLGGESQFSIRWEPGQLALDVVQLGLGTLNGHLARCRSRLRLRAASLVDDVASWGTVTPLALASYMVSVPICES